MTFSRVDTVRPQGVDTLDSQPLSPANEKKGSGLALHQVFNQDSLPIQGTNQTLVESQTPSFWSKVWSWWYQPEVMAQAQRTSSVETDLLDVAEIEPISPVPALEEPDEIPADLAAAQLPLISKNRREKMTQKELLEGLAQMSERSMEQIMFVILKVQMELEKEHANAAEGTFTKFEDFKKIQEKLLQEIKEIIAEDDKRLGYFNTAQNYTMAANFICGAAAAMIAFGLPVPAIVVGITAFAAPTVAACTGLAAGSRAYYQRRTNEDKAKHENIKYQDKYNSDRLEDARGYIMATSEADQAFKERLVRLLKRSQTMFKIISEK